MLNSASGLDLQAVIAGHLRSMGFQIMETAELDHEAKLDWVITKLPAWPRIIALGVQITARRGDLGKQGEFLARNRATNGNLPPVDRALYIEYDDRVHVGRGGAALVANAITSYLFDVQYSAQTIYGVTIQSQNDSVIGYTFFDLKEFLALASGTDGAAVTVMPIRRPVSFAYSSSTGPKVIAESAPAADPFPMPRELEGRLHSFLTKKRFGFVSAVDGCTYWAPCNEMSAELLAEIDKLPVSEDKNVLAYQVIFEPVASTREDAKYAVAKNMRILR